MTRFPYTYTILRYIHDIATGEFVNVGVVLVSAEARFARGRFLDQPGRLNRMFSDFNQGHFLRVIGHLAARFQQLSSQLEEQPYAAFPRDARIWATSVLKDDDSAFQWSPLRSGIGADLEQTLDRTYGRFVADHEDASWLEGNWYGDVHQIFGGALRDAERRRDFPRLTLCTGDRQERAPAREQRIALHRAAVIRSAPTAGVEAAATASPLVYFSVDSVQRHESQAAYEMPLGTPGKTLVRRRIVH